MRQQHIMDLHALLPFISCLSDRERMIMLTRYGPELQNDILVSLHDIASTFRVTVERIRQIESKAIRKLTQAKERKNVMGNYTEKIIDKGRTDVCQDCMHWHPSHYHISYTCSVSRMDKTLKELVDDIALSFQGCCHRYPPETGKSFPYTYKNSTCGEWKPKRCTDQTPLDALEWSVRAKNIFDKEGIKTVADLANLTTSDLLNMRWLGKKTLDEINSKLAKMGIIR